MAKFLLTVDIPTYLIEIYSYKKIYNIFGDFLLVVMCSNTVDEDSMNLVIL